MLVAASLASAQFDVSRIPETWKFPVRVVIVFNDLNGRAVLIATNTNHDHGPYPLSFIAPRSRLFPFINLPNLIHYEKFWPTKNSAIGCAGLRRKSPLRVDLPKVPPPKGRMELLSGLAAETPSALKEGMTTTGESGKIVTNGERL